MRLVPSLVACFAIVCAYIFALVLHFQVSSLFFASLLMFIIPTTSYQILLWYLKIGFGIKVGFG
jgi:hypothetical protein